MPSTGHGRKEGALIFVMPRRRCFTAVASELMYYRSEFNIGFLALDRAEPPYVSTADECCSFVTCREVFVEELRSLMIDKKNELPYRSRAPLLTSLLYLFAFRRSKQHLAKTCVSYAREIIAVFDDALECEPTRIQPVPFYKHTNSSTICNIPNSIPTFFVEADEVWLKTPEFVFLHTFLMRLSSYPEIKHLKLSDDLPTLLRNMEELGLKYKDRNPDFQRLSVYARVLEEIIEEHKETASRKSIRKTFRLSSAYEPLAYGPSQRGLDNICNEKNLCMRNT